MKTLKAIIAIAAITFSVPVNAAPQKMMTGNESAIHKAANDAVIGAAAVKVFCQNYLDDDQILFTVNAAIELGFAEPLLMAENDVRRSVGMKRTTQKDCQDALEFAAGAFEALNKIMKDGK